MSLLGERTGNLMDYLPWEELRSGLMHTREGNCETAFEIEVPSSAFMPDFDGPLATLRTMFENDLREGMRARLIITSGPADRNVFSKMREAVTAPEPGLRLMLEKRIQQFEDDWYDGGLRSWKVYCCVRLLNKPKKKSSLSSDDERARLTLAEGVRNRLTEQFEVAGFKTKALPDREIFALCYKYLNPSRWHYDLGEYTPTWHRYTEKFIEKVEGTRPSTLRTQLGEARIDNSTRKELIVDDHYVKIVALNKLPDRVTRSHMIDGALKGGKKFFVVIDLYHQPYPEGVNVARRRSIRLDAVADDESYKADPETLKAARQSRRVLDRIADGEQLYLVAMAVIMYDRDKARLEAQTEKLYTALQTVPGRPFRIIGSGLLTPFLQLAPLSGEDYTERVTLLTKNVVHFMPLSGPWRGAKNPVAYFNNRYYDLTGIDPHEGTNFNALAVGASGSGKTNLINMTVSWYLSKRAHKVVIIDRGGGYRPLSHFVCGARVSLDPGGGTCINPFDITPGAVAPTELELEDLQTALAAMIGKPAGLTGAQHEILRAATEQIYRGARKFDREQKREVFITPVLSDLVRKLRNLDEIGSMHAEPKHKDIADDLALDLQGWCGDTAHGKFIDGQTNIPLSNARLVYYDTDGLAGSGKLAPVGTLLISQHIERMIRANPEHKTLVMIDEGWALLKQDARAREFVGTMFRRFRRYGAGVWLITQTYQDVLDMPDITNNHEMFFGLRSSAQERALWEDQLQLPKRTMAFAKLVGSLAGKYAEAMCFFRRPGGWEGNIISVHPTPLDLACFSTTAEDIAIREKAVAAENGNVVNAVCKVAGTETPLAA